MTIAHIACGVVGLVAGWLTAGFVLVAYSEGEARARRERDAHGFGCDCMNCCAYELKRAIKEGG